MGASVRDESHRWDAESGSPAGFYGAPLPRREGPRGSHARVTPTATSRPHQRGRRLEPQPLKWLASVATHTPTHCGPLRGEKEAAKGEYPLEPALLPVESRQRQAQRGPFSVACPGNCQPSESGSIGTTILYLESISGVRATTVRSEREAAEVFPAPGASGSRARSTVLQGLQGLPCTY